MPPPTHDHQNPESGEAAEKVPQLFAQAFALHQGGNLAEAAALYEKILKAQPGYFDVIQLLGVIAAQTGNFPRAVELLTEALTIRPGHAATYNNRGASFKELGRLDAAIADYDQAVALKPDYVDAWYNRGIALKDLQQLDAAIASFDRAIAIKADHADTHNNRGIAFKELGQLDTAIADYDRAIAIRENFAEAHNNRGVALQDALRLDAAIASFDRAIALRPGYAEAWYNRGNALKEHGQPAAAIASYAQAISLRPGYVDAHWNLGICHLLLGDYAQGWQEYEWRWKENINKPEDHRNFTQPLWLSKESLAGKTILLYSEQGFGDTLQFCRYARLVADLGARVILEVQRPLAKLLTGLEGVSQLIARGDALPPFDYHCPLLSLPLAFGTDLQSIPASACYLHADPQTVTRWQAKLGAKTRPRVGIAWSGSVGHTNDRNRSMALADLAPLLSMDGEFEFVSLQKEIRAADREALQRFPHLRHFGDELADFTDTAALCELMDLVISVDTSVAHLAGALGRPVWLLLPFSPDWRWLLERTDTPWYPDARLYRQKRIGDWSGVIAQIGADLTGKTTMNDKSVEISRLFPQAFALHQQGKHSEAAALYAQILAAQPGHFEATQLMGVLAAQTNDYPRAVAFLTDALRIRPDHAATYNNRGITFKELGQLDAAIADYSQAIAFKPDYADAWYNRGIAFKELGQPDAAVADYRHAIECKPDFADAHNNLGVALQAIRQFDAAIDSYDRAIRIKPDFAEAFNNRGNALLELRQPDAAIASYDRAIAIKPNYARAWHNRGNALKELGELDKAITDYDRAIDIAPDYAEAWYHRGNALMKRGQSAAAISSYDRAIALEADHAEAYINRGAAWQALRKLDAASPTTAGRLPAGKILRKHTTILA